jgi:hypothetical protein
MTVHSQDLRDGKVQEGRRQIDLSVNQPIAIILWVLACITTWQLVAAVTVGAVWYFQVGAGIVLQAIFTVLERPILRGRPNKVSGTVLIVDTLVNAGGIFPFALRMSATPTAQMISATFSLSPQMTPPAAFAVSMIFGFLLAAAPEAVWRWRG